MVVFFEERDLVSFGNFLLRDVVEKQLSFQTSGDRDNVEFIDRLDGVTDADLQNWIYEESLKERENESTSN